MPRRPKRIAVADVNVRAIRGPKPEDRHCWYWQAQRSVDGVRQTVWSGWATRVEATRIVIDLVALSGTRAQPKPVPLAEEPTSASHLATVTDLLETWVGSRLSRFEAGDLTKYGYRNSRTDAGHIKRHLGDTAVARLRKADIEGYRNARLLEGAASSTVHRELKALRAAWSWARGDGYVPDRDLPKVGIKVTPVRDKYNPTPEEVWRVVDQLEGWAKFVAGMQAATGARVGEIARLTWADIHLSSGFMTLRGKTGPRPFPLTDKVREVLSWGDPDATYPHGTTESVVCGHLSSRELVAACAAAGVRRFSSHGFRRAAVDRLQRAGVDIKTAADLLGHSPETMLKYYREVSAEDRLSAAAILGGVAPALQRASDPAPQRASDPAPQRAAEPPQRAPEPAPQLALEPAPQRASETPAEAPLQPPRRAPLQGPSERKRVTDRGYILRTPDRRSGKSESPRTLSASEGSQIGTPKGNGTPRAATLYWPLTSLAAAASVRPSVR